ncbi:MAG: DinB family protein [Acidobacteriota bacterium]|nr:DinB family protein [Acidobacteriota bacterium]
MASKTVDLDQVEAGLRRTWQQVRELTDNLRTEQLGCSPEPRRWSLAQCLEHLVTTDGLYLDKVEAVLAKAPAKAAGHGARGHLRLWERLFVGSLEPPPKMRFPAPKIFLPADAETVPSGDSPERFSEHQERLLACLERARTVDLDRTIVVSPVSRLIRLRLGAAFALVEVHQRRHLEQMRRVAEHPDFPG